MNDDGADGPPPRASGAEPTRFLAEIGVEGAVGIVLMIALLIVMGLGVFFRYVLNDSLSWSEELSRYGLVAVTFLGCATAARRRAHIRIAILEDVLPDGAVRVLGWLQDAATLAFFVIVAVLAVKISVILWTTRSAAMQLPMSYVYTVIVVGFGLAALRLVLQRLPRRRP